MTISHSGLLFLATLYIVSGGALNSTHSLVHYDVTPACAVGTFLVARLPRSTFGVTA